MEERLASDQVTEAMAKLLGKHGLPGHVELLSRSTEPPLAERFAKFGRQIDAPRVDYEKTPFMLWSPEERAARLLPSLSPQVASEGHTRVDSAVNATVTEVVAVLER